MKTTNDARVSAKIETIRRAAGADMSRCPTCTHAPDAPFRRRSPLLPRAGRTVAVEDAKDAMTEDTMHRDEIDSIDDDYVIEVIGCPSASCDASSHEPCVDRRPEALGRAPITMDRPHVARRRAALSIKRDIERAGCLPEHDPEGYEAGMRAWLERQRATGR